MYLSRRSILVRNIAIAAVNGSITLIILLIAPMGLAAVIINTLLVTLSSFTTATVVDRVILFLSPPVKNLELDRTQDPQESVGSNRKRKWIDRY